MMAAAKSPGLKGYNMELRTSIIGENLLLKRGGRTISGNADGILADSNTYLNKGAEQFSPHLWRRAWTEAQAASSQLRNSIKVTPTIGA